MPIKRQIRRFFKKAFRHDNIFKVIIIISGLAIIATAILPYIF